MNDVRETRCFTWLVWASIFLILWDPRFSAQHQLILLAVVITIMVLPVPSRLTKRGMPGWLAMVLSILMVVLILTGHCDGFLTTQLVTQLPI